MSRSTKYLLLSFVFFSNLFCGVVWLLNDSPYNLEATVTSATGKEIGKITLKAGEQNTWVTSLAPYDLKSDYNAESSQTPYSVTWKCPNGGFYSTCNPVSPGGLVSATLCSGSHYCRPPPKKKKPTPPPQCKCECNCCDEEEKSSKKP